METNSSSISCIRSALHDLQLLEGMSDAHKPSLKILMFRLRNLATFVLCAGNKSGSYDLKSLLVRIEDAVRRNGDRINSCCLYARLSPTGGFEDGIPADVVEDIVRFQEEIRSFAGEIIGCYVDLSDLSWQSSSPTPDEVLEIIDSVLENVADILLDAPEEGLAEAMEALQEKLSFLKSFIRFSTTPGVERPPQSLDLLAHVEVVALRAAHLSYLCQFHEVDAQEMRAGIMHSKGHKIAQLLQQIKHIDSQVGETYTRALTVSKQSTYLKGNLDLMMTTTKDFIDSLICNLWEMLQMDSCVAKDQLQVLYEALRSLRTIFKEQHKKFDDKMMDITRVVACDAGILIFSCSRKDVDISVGLLDLLEKIKFIRTELEEEVAQTSATSASPEANDELDFVDHLLESLKELTSGGPDSDAWSCVQIIREELVFLRSFMGEILELRREQEELETLWKRVVEVGHWVNFLIDPLVVGNIPDSSSTSFDSIIGDIRRVKADVLKIYPGKSRDEEVMEVTRTLGDVASQSSAQTSDGVVGMEDKTTLIINRLLRGSEKLKIVVITGMPGIGKTTLAQKVYDDCSVALHFHVRARCSVSQTFDRNRVVLELLSQIFPGTNFDATNQDLEKELWQSLRKQKYLIFLDDVWDIGVWNSLTDLFEDDTQGSRIILTSRDSAVAPQDKLDEEPVFLQPLDEKDSWELLKRKVFPGSSCPPALENLGFRIAKSCKGIPLTIIIVAGILTSTAYGDWKKVLQSLCSGVISTEQQCKNSLQLSYQHLPPHLKQCFLYFGIFPEDQEVPANRLIWLWIAEGLVEKKESESLEAVATDYMKALIGRSLIMVAKQRSKGGVKFCRIHDLLRDFCIKKAKAKGVFQMLRGYDELLAFNEPFNLKRLCIHSEPKQFKDSRLYCPRARSLLFFDRVEWFRRSLDISFVIYIFKLVEVLEIGQINLGSVFPSEMEHLVHLKYLAVRGEMEDIPPSIGKLLNLETFTVDSTKTKVSLPDTFWNLQRLRTLYIENAYDVTGFVLPVKNLDSSPDLLELESFSGAIISWEHMEKQMKKFPNIRKLKCKLQGFGVDAENRNKIAVPHSLTRLESLDVSPLSAYAARPSNHVEFEFDFPEKLTKLTLSGFGLPWSKMSRIGELRNLKVLKLLGRAFSGRIWNVENGQFPELSYLKLASLNVVRWTTSDEYDRFPCLQTLAFESCKRLGEIPSCLEDTLTLETIEISNCSNRLTTAVQNIDAFRKGMGYQALKIRIPTHFSKSL